MTAAAFKAVVADWKLVRTRKVVQIVFEVPLEAADAAYQVIGGMPDPATSLWFGIAKLDPKGGDDHDPDGQQQGTLVTTPRQETKTGGARKWDELPYSQQAAMACVDPIFQAFLREGHGLRADTAADTAQNVRAWCGVTSRSDLNSNPEAAAAWLRLYDGYRSWKLAERISA